MDAKYGGSVREMLIVSLQRFLNVDLFKFSHGFFEENTAIEHLFHQGFEFSAQFLRSPFLWSVLKRSRKRCLRREPSTNPVRLEACRLPSNGRWWRLQPLQESQARVVVYPNQVFPNSP